MVSFLDDGFVKTAKGMYRQYLSVTQRKWFLLGAWGVIIILFVSYLDFVQVFAKRETFFLQFRSFAAMQRKESYEKYLVERGYDKYLEDEPVRYFILSSVDNNNFKYINDIYTIARDLKEAGAKVVVADAPGWAIGYLGLWAGDTSATMMRKISALDIVVWATRSPKMPNAHYARDVDIRLHESHTARDASGPTRDFVNSAEHNGTPPIEALITQPIVRWHPIMKHQMPFGPTLYNVDVAIVVAQRYFDIPDTCTLTNDGKALHLRELTIPISSDGTAFSDNSIRPVYQPQPVSATRGLSRSPMGDKDQDRVWYHEPQLPGKMPQVSLDADTLKDLLKFKKYYAGKVVVVEWLNNGPTSDIFSKVTTANVISSLLRNTVYKKIGTLNAVLMIISIALLALFSAKVKIRWSVLGSLLLIAGIIMFAGWLFFAFRIIFDPVYPILSVVLAFFIFSLVKIAFESDIK